MSEFQFNTIDEILEDLRDGKIVVMIDDEDRENEGDVICAAEHATLENVNFMASYAKGLICMPPYARYALKRRLFWLAAGTYVPAYENRPVLHPDLPFSSP